LKPWFPLRTAATATLPPRKDRIAFFSLTSGAANTALGQFSLHSVTTGSFNTGIDAGTLVLNTGDENIAIGTAALLPNTANSNTDVASGALLNNTTGGRLTNIQRIDVGPNVAVGQGLQNNTVTGANTAVGYQALHSFISGPMGFEPVGLPILSPAVKTVNPTACAISR